MLPGEAAELWPVGHLRELFRFLQTVGNFGRRGICFMLAEYLTTLIINSVIY